MGIVLITGSGGLIGSEAATYFAGLGYDVVGIDNDMRARFFGASVQPRLDALQATLGNRYTHHSIDIRDDVTLRQWFEHYGRAVKAVIHTAAQPSHDYAAQHPHQDFSINALGTLNLLEAAHQYAPDAPFIFTSTNKVYGDRPNAIPLEEQDTRYDVSQQHAAWHGVSETMSVDGCLHSLFGASKLAADVLVQEYGRYFGMQTVCFRAGCLTGQHHAGAEQHGFLAYLVQCTRAGKPYTIYGYKGKQVRDNLHAADLVRAFDEFLHNPRSGVVYNIGGGRGNSLSVLEAIARCEVWAGRKLDYSLSPHARIGDHQWYITNNQKFQMDYPHWRVRVTLDDLFEAFFEKELA